MFGSNRGDGKRSSEVLTIKGEQSGQREAPLYAAVRAHLRKKFSALHVPLHGGGSGAPDLLRRGFSAALRWDLTELDALDDLHLPQGAIRKAQELAADLFGAEATFFLVNGVTGGLLALFSAFCRPGDKVLLTRMAHKAALHGIALSGARPVYLPVEREHCSGFPLNVAVKTVEKALQEHPEARLLFMTSPSYWGVTADLAAMQRVAAQYGVLLAVDEAHGTHFPFYREKLPHSAAAGADVWLHSAHKSLGSLTPGAFLHLGKKALRFAPGLKFWLQVLQTSSPSYPLMLSLDLVRRQAALKGGKLFSAAWRWARRLRRELEGKGFTLLTGGHGGEFNLDPCRVTILCPGGTGSALARRLAQKYRWQVEMSGRSYLLAITGPAQLSSSPRRLARALEGARAGLVPFSPADARVSAPAAADYSGDFPPSLFRGGGEAFPAFSLPPGEALRRPNLGLPLQEAAGKICAEMVVLSPPGIPLLAPGEVIREEMLGHILQQRAEGRLFQGAADPSLQTIKVVRKDTYMVE
ncbi:MAG: aminotransferase class I/II-fold pyridoxal phosphate-dependent enzyme [Dethiobacteria bacterium]